MTVDPNRFDEFVIESMIGEGGMGKVYRARQTALDRWVALKVLPRAKENRNFIERFYREARSAARLVHPNIIQIHTVGELQGVPYYTMEYVEGDDLEHIIRDNEASLSMDEVIEVGRSVVKALGIASEHGVVHRDIKPANIMISKTGLVKVMDFGLAKELDHNITQSGVVVGTPTYMSPEQGGGLTVDFRSDLYSLGCVLYECIKGQPPFHAEKVAAVIYKHMFEPPPPLNSPETPVDLNLEHFILKALSKKPEDRFQTPVDALEALSKLSFNSAGAELSLAKHAQKCLKARKAHSPEHLLNDPDAPKMLVPQPAVPIKPDPQPKAQPKAPPAPTKAPIEARAPVKPAAHGAPKPNPETPAKAPAPHPAANPAAKNAPRMPAERLPTEKVGFLRIKTPPPALPPQADSTRAPAEAATVRDEAQSLKPPPKPLNMLKPPPRKDSSGIIRDGKRPPSININIPKPSSILDEAEIVERKSSLPVMRVHPRPGSISTLFAKLPDGRWSYSKDLLTCEHAEGLAQKLPPEPNADVKDRGLGDCLLCANWNKRAGCAVAYTDELIVKGRFNGLKLLTEQALGWLGAGRFDKAIALLNEFVEDNPKNADGFRELARIYDRPDYKGRDKRRGIILYSRFAELAREAGGYSQIEISRAEARANAMRTMTTSGSSMSVGEVLEFSCFYRGITECFAYCRMDMDELLVLRVGYVDPSTGVSEPDPAAGVGAFRRAKSMFTRTKTEQEKQEEQSAVRKELQRLADLDSGILKTDPSRLCALDFKALGSLEYQLRPPDLSVVKVKERSMAHVFLFTATNNFEGLQVHEFLSRRLK